MNKKLPKLNTDEDAETFVAEVDLTEYDLSGMSLVSFEFQQKSKRVILNLSEALFDSIKEEANRSGIPYQHFIRQTLENAVRFRP